MNLDGGEYKCVVSSAEFKLETAATKLTVWEIPRFTVQPVKCTVFSGGNAKFEVQATGYDLQYVWQYYDAVSKSWINIDTETSNELIVSKAEFERNGMKYRCAISNGGESNITYSKAATMVVKQTAQYDEQPESTTVIVGKNAKFAVKASGLRAYTTSGNTASRNPPSGKRFRARLRQAFPYPSRQRPWTAANIGATF